MARSWSIVWMGVSGTRVVLYVQNRDEISFGTCYTGESYYGSNFGPLTCSALRLILSNFFCSKKFETWWQIC